VTIPLPTEPDRELVRFDHENRDRHGDRARPVAEFFRTFHVLRRVLKLDKLSAIGEP
jgi:hypothetical protein